MDCADRAIVGCCKPGERRTPANSWRRSGILRPARSSLRCHRAALTSAVPATLRWPPAGDSSPTPAERRTAGGPGEATGPGCCLTKGERACSCGKLRHVPREEAGASRRRGQDRRCLSMRQTGRHSARGASRVPPRRRRTLAARLGGRRATSRCVHRLAGLGRTRCSDRPVAGPPMAAAVQSSIGRTVWRRNSARFLAN